MCIARNGSAQMSEGLWLTARCIVTDSIRKIYSSAANELTWNQWIMYLIRKLEDGENLDCYLKNTNLKERLIWQIQRLSTEEIQLIKWKIESVSRDKKTANNPIILFISSNIQ